METKVLIRLFVNGNAKLNVCGEKNVVFVDSCVELLFESQRVLT